MKTLEEILKEAAKPRSARRGDTPVQTQPAAPQAAPSPNAPKARAKDTSADPTAPIAPANAPGTPPAPAAPAAPVAPGQAKPTGVSNKQPQYVPPADFAAVIEMQKAILEFGHVAAGTDAFKMSPTGTGKQDNTTGEYLGGHDPFSSFLFSNYLDVSKDKPGKGFMAIENLNQKMRMDTAKDRPEVNNLRNWVETIMHVGSPTKGGEYKPDGVWGPRTNNALKAIADFSEMMFRFAKDMDIGLDEFPTKGLEEFRAKIPNVSDTGALSGNNGATAKVLTSYIKTLTGVISSFKTKIMESNSWKDYLSQDKALLKGNSSPLNKQEKVTLQLHGQLPLNLGDEGEVSGFKGLTLNDLSTKEKFVAYLKKMNVPAERPEEVAKAINLVRSYLQKNDKGAVL